MKSAVGIGAFVIQRVHLKDFKSHDRTGVEDLGSIAVFIGRNNAGKSSILHSIALGRHKEYGSAIGPAMELVRSGCKAAEVQIDGKVGTLNAGITWNVANGGIRGNVRGAANQEVGQEFHSRMTKRVFYLASYRRPPHLQKYAASTNDVGVHGGNVTNVLFQLMARRDDRLEKINDWAAKLELDVDSVITASRGPDNAALSLTSQGVEVDLPFMGSGVASVLPIVVQGVLAEQGDTLLIEEPETHLHRHAMVRLWEFFDECAQRGVQIMFTTHSLDLLTAMQRLVHAGKLHELPSIHLVKRESGASSVEELQVDAFSAVAAAIEKELAEDAVPEALAPWAASRAPGWATGMD